MSHAGGLGGYLVAAGATGLDDEILGPQFAQVIGGLADAVVRVALRTHRPGPWR